MIRYVERLPSKVMPSEFKELLNKYLNEGNELEKKLKIANAFLESGDKKTP